MKELIQAVRAFANADSTLSTAISSDIYFERAPNTETMPYITFHLISEAPRRCFRSADDWEDYLVQFSIFSNNSSVSESLIIQSDLDLAFDRQNLTYTTKTSIACHREGTTGPTWLSEDGVYMTTSTYRIQSTL